MTNSEPGGSSPQTPEFTADQIDALGRRAERTCDRRMTDGERARFEDELFNACEVAKPLLRPTPTPAEQRSIAAGVAADLRVQGRRLSPLVTAIEPDTAELHRRQDRVMTIQHRLFDFAEQLDELAERIKVKPGRNSNQPGWLDLLNCLRRAWEIGARRDAATQSDHEGKTREGAFVDFFREAMSIVDPPGLIGSPPGLPWNMRTNLGQTIQRALRKIRTVVPKGGQK
jgi:hypothetical protein